MLLSQLVILETFVSQYISVEWKVTIEWQQNVGGTKTDGTDKMVKSSDTVCDKHIASFANVAALQVPNITVSRTGLFYANIRMKFHFNY